MSRSPSRLPERRWLVTGHPCYGVPQLRTKPEVSGILAVRPMPLQFLDERGHVDRQGQQLQWEELRILAGQSRRHGGDAIGADDELGSQIERRRHHLDGPFVIEAPQRTFIVIVGSWFADTDDHVSEPQVLIE